MASLWILSIVIIISIWLFKSTRQAKDKNGVPYRLPPGPRGWPIVGNTQIPTRDQEPVLSALARQYGEMYAPLSLSNIGSR
jgi:hypothetical protein